MLVDWTNSHDPLIETGGHAKSVEKGRDLISLLREANERGPKFTAKPLLCNRVGLVGKADQFENNNPTMRKDPKADYYAQARKLWGKDPILQRNIKIPFFWGRTDAVVSPNNV